MYKAKKIKLVEFSLGGVVRIGQFSTKEKKIKKNAKMIRMVKFIQKTEDLNFLLLGGSCQIFGLIVRFYFNFILFYFILFLC